MKNIYQLTEEELQQLLKEQRVLCDKMIVQTSEVFNYVGNAPSPDFSKYKVPENESVEFDLRERAEIVDMAIRCEEKLDSRELIEWFTNKFKNRNK